MNFVTIPLLNGDHITLNLNAVAYITERSIVLNRVSDPEGRMTEFLVTQTTAKLLSQVVEKLSLAVTDLVTL